MPTFSPIPFQAERRLPSLDGLRALAVGMVIWFHGDHPPNLWLSWIPDGSFGVRVFFVISGYIITRLLLIEEASFGHISLLAFYKRRALRILPALWLYLGGLLVLSKLGCFPISLHNDVLPAITFSTGAGWKRPMVWQVGHTWSLSIEEQFYLLWPAAFVLSHKFLRISIAVAAVCLGPCVRYYMYFHSHRHFGFTIIEHGDILAIGCLVAMVEAQWPARVSKVADWRPVIGRLVALGVIHYSGRYFAQAFSRAGTGFSGTALTYSTQALAVGYLILSFTHVRRGVLYWLLNVKWLAALGLVSYGLYLWQQPFARPDTRWWTHFPANFACMAAAVTVSYFCVEQPIRRLGRKPGRAPNFVQRPLAEKI